MSDVSTTYTKVIPAPVPCDYPDCRLLATHCAIDVDENWHNYCKQHMDSEGFGLGEGLGYQLVVVSTSDVPDIDFGPPDVVGDDPGEWETVHKDDDEVSQSPACDSGSGADGWVAVPNKSREQRRLDTQPGPMPKLQSVKAREQPLPGYDVYQVCKHCGESKPLTDFYQRSDDKSQRLTTCKVCQSRRRREIATTKRAYDGTTTYIQLEGRIQQLALAENKPARYLQLAEELKITIDKLLTRYK
jgi:hypothetical protein